MISATSNQKDDRSSEDDVTKIKRKGVMIMDKLEKVEKLREKTGVSYEDAKNALEACDYDLLDAIIYLEKLDKVKAPEVESFTTGAEQQTSTEFEQAQRTYTNDCNKVTFGQMMDRFFKWCGKVLKKSVDSTFIVERKGQTMINVPVLVLVIALILAFWVVLPLLVDDSNIYMPANATDYQYFSTSLLIGDSRAEALGLYSGVDNWDMCVAKNLDIEKVANTKMFTCDSGEQCTVVEMLGMKSYENIYISFGLEELSWYNERYMSAYKTLLDQISQLQPAANVYVMSVIPVSAELSSKDQVYNNPGVDKLNSLMQEMCGSYDQVIYLDVAHSVSVDGVLPEDAGIDGKHCNKKYCLKMMDYIRKNVYVRR